MTAARQAQLYHLEMSRYRVHVYGTAVAICLNLRHPLRAMLPALDAAPHADAVARILLAHPDALDRWALAVSA